MQFGCIRCLGPIRALGSSSGGWDRASRAFYSEECWDREYFEEYDVWHGGRTP